MSSRSMLLTIAAASSLAVMAYGLMPRDQPDYPARPAPAGCRLDQVEGSAWLSPARVRSFRIAGIHLGMPVEDAFRILASVSEAHRIGVGKPGLDARSIIGKAAWSDYAWGRSFRSGILPMDGRWGNPADNVTIGTSIYRDGRERVSSIQYSVESFSPMPTADDPSPRNGVTSLMENWLKHKLGQPSFRNGSCNDGTIIAYGSEPKMQDAAALATYESCKVSGGITVNRAFVCDRRRALQKPWIGLLGGNRSFDLLIQDGEAAYYTRYSHGFEASHPIFEY